MNGSSGMSMSSWPWVARVPSTATQKTSPVSACAAFQRSMATPTA